VNTFYTRFRILYEIYVKMKERERERERIEESYIM